MHPLRRRARITGNLYSLESEGDGSTIDLSAGGTKVITGNMLSADGGNINVEMDTGDSLFTGVSIVQDADSETDISMSNGGVEHDRRQYGHQLCYEQRGCGEYDSQYRLLDTDCG